MMTTAKSKRKRTSERDEENKQVIQCLERKLAWRKHNIQPENLMNSFLYIQGPLQMNMGFPKKETRVPGLINNKVAEPTVFFNCLLWTPDVVLIDAMF